MDKADLTSEALRLLVAYDPVTGVFTRRISRGGTKAGSILGAHSAQPHLHASINGSFCLLHRLAWLYMTGAWPTAEIDHINGDGRDNRWQNLRNATHSLNQQNRKRAQSNNTSGELGVSRFRNKYRAQINALGKRHYIGYFDTVAEAAEAYRRAKLELHPDV
jgi:hypothetical protein